MSNRSVPRWKELFGLDVRSLALFRFVLGLIVLGDLIDRGVYLTEHYTDDGMLINSNFAYKY